MHWNLKMKTKLINIKTNKKKWEKKWKEGIKCNQLLIYRLILFKNSLKSILNFCSCSLLFFMRIVKLIFLIFHLFKQVSIYGVEFKHRFFLILIAIASRGETKFKTQICEENCFSFVFNPRKKKCSKVGLISF